MCSKMYQLNRLYVCLDVNHNLFGILPLAFDGFDSQSVSFSLDYRRFHPIIIHLIKTH